MNFAYGGLRPRSDFGIRNADFGIQLIEVFNLHSKSRNLKSQGGLATPIRELQGWIGVGKTP